MGRPEGKAWHMERAVVRDKSTRRAGTNIYKNKSEYYEGKVRKKTGKRSLHSRRAHKMNPIKTRKVDGTARMYPTYRRFHTHSVDGTTYCHPVTRKHRTARARAVHKRARAKR